MSSALLRRAVPAVRWAIAACALAFAPASATAQSLSSGAIAATIVDDRGLPIPEATISLERAGIAFRTAETDRAGRVRLGLLAPGRYAVLAEQLGYQPVRATGVTVIAGGESRVTIRLARRPPPITSVEERVAEVTISGGSSAGGIAGSDLVTLDRRTDLSDLSRHGTTFLTAWDGRDGLALGGNALAASYQRAVIDGIEETILRHPGLPAEPATLPLFARLGIDQGALLGYAQDAEWRGAPGGLLTAQSRRGGSRLAISPWAAFSPASVGGRALDNPADSSAMSIQAGATLGGPIKGDSGAWFLRFDYQQLERPTAAPFEGVDAAAVIQGVRPQAAEALAPWLAPTVRRWKGGSGSGRVDYRLGRNAVLAVRGGLASWTEENPQAGIEAVSGAGARLEAKDFSFGGTLALTGADWTSETRLGVRSSRREWLGADAPFTGLVGDGLAFGGAFTLPGLFKESGIELSEAITYRTGDHTLKVGGAAQRRGITSDWVPGIGGRFDFGDATRFGTSRGAWYAASRSGEVEDLSVMEAGLFLQDVWQATATLQLFGGVRYEIQTLPTDVIETHAGWGQVSGRLNALVPTDRKGNPAPRAGFQWDVRGGGRTVLRGSAGLVSGRYDLAALAEASQYDGDVTVRRATGELTWPAGPANATARTALTYFAPEVRRPRAFHGELALVQAVGTGTLTLQGAYHHTDFLLRREDANRAVAPLATASDGRAIWGELEQYGGLLTPAVGSNRRFREFDAVHVFTSTGYADVYEATVAFEQRFGARLALHAEYTWSKSEDNLVGQLSADPADRLSPFPVGTDGADWDVARSDLDIPSRFAATLRWGGDGSPIGLAARFRARSGLPFTPGFPRGVDANGDGAGGNDPAPLAGANLGTACDGGGDGMAARNACRDPMVRSLDLSAQIALPVGGARRVLLTIDGFNVVGTGTGLYDHAAVKVNPAGTITTGQGGRLVLPLVANENFGKLLSRRGEARTLRIGFRVEN